jgi:hypothetical protein
MGPARLSLYLIAFTAGIAAIITWRSHRKALAADAGNRPQVEKLATVLRESWGEYHR